MYIGNPLIQSAFLVDTFSGNNSTTVFTMSVAPANTASVLVAVSGVLQDPATYAVVGTTLTFTQAPPTGTGNISARYLGIPASGVTTTAYRTVTTFTATASQTTFTPPSYTVGFINVYRNGVLLTPTSDYTASNGTTVVLASGAASGDTVIVESFLVSSVLNAIPNTAGSVSNSNLGPLSTLPVTGGTTLTLPTITANLMAVGASFGVYLANSISIPDTTNTKITFDTVDFNIGSGYSTSTGLFTAPIAGRYFFTSSAYIYSVAYAGLFIYKNGTVFKRFANVTAASNVNPNYAQCSLVMNLAANDTISIYAYQQSGASATIYNGSTRETYFSGTYLGT